jgi:uncharacterized protein YndB with AHSA1/START domain
MSHRVTTSKITLNASPARVWEALTRPELVKQWQYGTELITDWREGGPIVFRSEWQGHVFKQKGTVLEVKPEQLVKYTLFAPRPGLEDRPENYFTMSYLLEELGDQTRLTIIQDDPREQQSQDQSEEQPEDESENSVLQTLRKLVEA